MATTKTRDRPLRETLELVQQMVRETKVMLEKYFKKQNEIDGRSISLNSRNTTQENNHNRTEEETNREDLEDAVKSDEELANHIIGTDEIPVTAMKIKDIDVEETLVGKEADQVNKSVQASRKSPQLNIGGVNATGEFSAEELLSIEGKQNIEEKSMDRIKIQKKQDLRRGVLPKIAEINLIGWASEAEPYSELPIGSPINHREIMFGCIEDPAHSWFQGNKKRVRENATHPWFQWVKKKAPDKATHPCKGIADWKPWRWNSGLQSEGLQTGKIEWAWAKLPCIGLVFKGARGENWSNPNEVGLNAKKACIQRD